MHTCSLRRARLICAIMSLYHDSDFDSINDDENDHDNCHYRCLFRTHRAGGTSRKKTFCTRGLRQTRIPGEQLFDPSKAEMTCGLVKAPISKEPSQLHIFTSESALERKRKVDCRLLCRNSRIASAEGREAT